MSQLNLKRSTRNFSWRRWLCIGLLLLVWSEWSGLDFWLQDKIYDSHAGTFPLMHNWLLQDVLHDGVKRVVIAVWLILLGVRLFTDRLHLDQLWRRGLNYFLITSTLIAGSIAFFKHHSHIFCPWDLQRYGGDQPFVPLIGHAKNTTRVGQCWPAGHVSTALSFLGAYFFLRDVNRRVALMVLTGVLALFLALAVAQTLRGAHFLSHNLWSLWWAWGVAAGVAQCYPPVQSAH